MTRLFAEVSRRFIKEIGKLMEDVLTRSLDDDYPFMVVDSIKPSNMIILADMGIDRDGQKRMLGIIEGGPGDSTVAQGIVKI